MKKLGIVLIGILVVFLFAAGYVIKLRNNLVVMDEGINTQWAQVENQMTRRFDLIPNLVNTVKGYANQEKSIFLGIAESRAKLAGAKTVNDKVAASNGMESALSRLLVVVEQYPNLKSNENFTRLMDELAGAENRLSVERMRYNDAVKVYNIRIRSFPATVFAGMFGFDKKNLLEAPTAAKVAPTVNFQ